MNCFDSLFFFFLLLFLDDSSSVSYELFILGTLIPCDFRNTPEDTPIVDTSKGPELMEERLTKEEWQAINNLLSYQPDEDLTGTSGKDMENMIQYFIDVSIGQAGARIVSFNKTEIVSGRFEQLHVSTKFKHRSTHCDVTLKFYGFSVPEGSLAQVCVH